ncbi:major capsid protein [Barnesiella viscericola]|uniref:major capsid protein n=1 Tax=Barnesiella viscericola TaxID=397865 RepID=UPI0025A3B5EB|nr:major capsid protein [Barnesiella viscericola]MDM8268198.1 major capsid protein [Barnesiella viscericola]
MANIFNLSNDQTPDVNRNTFDLSFQNNFTAQFGYLYPVFCKEVLPGDTFKIRPTFALEMMPMVFPVQTRMRANLHFFYCRNRAAYDDFQDWIGNTNPDADPPYIDMKANFDNMCKTGSLGDYMGLPTTLVGAYGNFARGELAAATFDPSSNFRQCFYIDGSVSSLVAGSEYKVYGNGQPSGLTQFGAIYYSAPVDFKTKPVTGSVISVNQLPSSIDLLWSGLAQVQSFNVKVYLAYIKNATEVLGADELTSESVQVQTTSSDGRFHLSIPLGSSLLDSFSATVPDGVTGYQLVLAISSVDASGKPTAWSPIAAYYSAYMGTSPYAAGVLGLGKANEDDGPIDLERALSPYYDSGLNPNGIKVNALPFRHYEALCNTFYRDSRNNPLMVNGKPVYNQVYLTTEGGADTTPYALRRRNWESDFLTTAVQSPQQGAAPLVGISSTGKMTFQDETGKQYQAQAEFAEDGETITGFKVLSDDMPQANMRSLIDMSTSGISIADLRQVNSLQRWLEANMRKGLRYRDQMKAHFGIDIAYKELNMPEFIGGCSEDVRVNMVTQTTPVGSPDDPESTPLGSYAGQASCVGTSNHDVDQYCDEHGYIIGIFSVTPVPNYSQLLPKHFIKRNIMDYFFPEFGNLGFVPIKYDEVCPVQAKNAGDDLNGTFGYQRAWYDYLASVDEVHGEFRKSMRDYLMNRTFDAKPELSESFLLVDPKQLNEVFAVTSQSDDKIMGQIYFDCKVKRPIPLFGIPRLE